jgi:ketosteroid isomerase-like protein
MSEQNVQVVRALFAAWAERDGAAAMKHVDPEVEFDFSAIAALGDEFGSGQTAVALQDRVASWFRIFESLEFSPEQFIDLGDHVIVLLTARGRGRQSGVPLDWRLAVAYTLRDGLVVRFRGFDKLSEAASSVGL